MKLNFQPVEVIEKSGKKLLKILDQRMLPEKEVYRTLENSKEVAEAIYTLSIRGAPMIGVCAALGLACAILNGENPEEARQNLLNTRPTAKNLFWAIERVFKSFKEKGKDAAMEEALRIKQMETEASKKIGLNGVELLSRQSVVLTHCNTGALAAPGWGTALAVIYFGWERGKIKKVYVDETRPLLQGARLTMWELKKQGIPCTLIPDSAASWIMKSEGVDAILVGADRIAKNLDVANKIGTYQLAISAKFHSVPFYVAAPTSTFDEETPTGEEIPIEERPPEEVSSTFAENVRNPAFDVTPSHLISAIITEKGIIKP